MEVQRRGPWRHPSVPCVAGPTAKVASVRPHAGRTGERGRAGLSGACVLAVGSPFSGAVALERHVFGAVSGQTLGYT